MFLVFISLISELDRNWSLFLTTNPSNSNTQSSSVMYKEWFLGRFSKLCSVARYKEDFYVILYKMEL
jgi:hypothetical protein